MPGADPRGELVLVLAPTGRDARLIADELRRQGGVALVCPTLDHLCVEIRAGAGIAVLAEEALPPAGLSCLVETLGRQPAWSDLPLLVLTGKGTPSSGSLRRFQALEPVANVTQLERPVQTRTLLAAVRSALRARRRQYDVREHLAGRDRAEAELRASEARHRFLAEFAAGTQPLTDPDEVMGTAARLLAEHLGADRCAYAEVEGESVYVITGDHTRGVPSIVGRWDVSAFGAEHLRLMRAGEPYAVDDADADPRIDADDRAAYRATAIRAVVCVPLLKGGRFIAAMAVHQAAPRRWAPAEVELVTLVAGRCWEALERARVARTLRQAEVRFRAAVAATSEILWTNDPAGRMTGDQPGWAAFTGQSPDEYWGYGWATAVHPDDARPTIDEWNRAVAERRTFVFEHRVRRRDGEYREFSVRAVPLLNADGSVREWVGTHTDVTDRKRAAEALRVSEERLALAQRAASVGTWDWNLLTGEVTWSEGLYLLLDRTPAEITPSAEAWRDILHPDDRAETYRLVEQAIRTAGEFYAEFRARRRDGAYVWVASRGRVYVAGDAPARFLGVNYDISERKRVEARLRASEERFRAFMDHSPAAAWVTDADGVLWYLSGTYLRMFKLPEGDLIGSSVFDVYPADIAHEYLDNIRRVADAGRPVEAVEPGPRPDGTVGRFLVYKFPLPGEDRLIGGVAVDITERLLAEEALKEADRRKDDFIALLAHELRNPLAPIRNGLQVIRLAEDRAARERAQQMMDRQLGHMVRLIDDLLDVSRITRNKLALRRTRLLLSDVVNSAVETVRPTLDAVGHHLAVFLPDAPVYLDADLTRLAQVVGNLLSNSVKYTPPGGHIRLTAEVDGGQAVVTVSDTGIGIPAASLPNIFDMFSQVDRSIERSTGGLGIGLALVKGLAEMHGGTVTAESDGQGRGSRFTVRLPLLPKSPEPLAAERTREVQVSGSGRRVLVVDDNRDAVESMAEMLKLLGYSVAVAHDGLEAVAAAERQRPDVVLMDVGMPRLNGLDATRRIREQPWGKELKIVALTGWGQDNDRARSKEAGCDGHLVKPVDLAELGKVLATPPVRPKGG